MLITMLSLSVGFIFLYFDLAEFGLVIFIVLPFIIGLVVGRLPKISWAIYGLLTGILLFLLLLIAGALEGLICVIMLLPIFILLLFVGLGIRILIKGKEPEKTSLNMVAIPLVLIAVLAPAEKFGLNQTTAIEEVRTEINLNYSTLQVYNAIKSVDTLIAEKPFLMNLDLPIPEKCVLEKEEVGGLRTCYFSGGTITERITQLEPGKILRMDVIGYQLTGVRWLGFKEAIYTFEPTKNNGCKMTRVTTYSSKLKPRFYWSWFEQLGISQEHEYVFRNLERDLKLRYSGQ